MKPCDSLKDAFLRDFRLRILWSGLDLTQQWFEVSYIFCVIFFVKILLNYK